MMPPIDSSPARVRLLLYLSRERPAGKGGIGTFRPGCWGTALALGQDSHVSKCHINPDTLPGPGNFLLCQNNVRHCWDNWIFQTGLTQICCLSNNGLLILLHTKHAHFSMGAEMFSSRISNLQFEFGCLWLTGEWTIGLHQKVQPDNLIWQPSSTQTYFSFWALNHLD